MKLDCKCFLNCATSVLLLIFIAFAWMNFYCDKKILESDKFVKLTELSYLSETIHHNKYLLSDDLKNEHNNLALKINAMIDYTIAYHQPFDKKLFKEIEKQSDLLSDLFNKKINPENKEEELKQKKAMGTVPAMILENIKDIYDTQRKAFNETLKEYKWRLIY